MGKHHGHSKRNNEEPKCRNVKNEANHAIQGLREARAYPEVPDAIGWTHGASYQIQQQGFFNTTPNGEGFGTIKGVEAKLDYLEDLGVESIYLTQPTDGFSYYGFDTIDAKLIEPTTGTNDDFVRLIKEAHKRKIQIVMGSVWHQTSVDHPFFQKALTGDPEFMDRYYFAIDPPFTFNIFFQSLWGSVKEDFPNSALAQRSENWFWRSKFGTGERGVADTNLNNPIMIDWVIDFSKYWICKGVDGFRIDVDTTSEISRVIDGKYVNGTDPNGYLNRQIIDRLRKIKSDHILYAEAFSVTIDEKPYLESVFESGRSFGAANDYPLRNSLVALQAGNLTAEQVLDNYLTKILPNVSKYTDVTFLENHDISRFISAVTIGNVVITVTLTPPTTSYSPVTANSGVFRVHYDKNSLPESLLNNNMNLYYFSANGGSNPFPSGSVNNLGAPDGLAFLGGGNDDFGPYWDFDVNFLGNFGPGVFGYIVIEKNNFIKVSGDIVINNDQGAILVANNGGDVFTYGLPVPTTLPTEEQYDIVKTFYGLLFALPGTPQLWQGQEFGMQSSTGPGISDSTREPLIWTNEGTQVKGFNPYNLPFGIASPGYENLFSTVDTVRPPGFDNSLWVYVREASRVRKVSPALKLGKMEKINLPGDPSSDVVVIYDQGQNTVTSSDLMAFKRTLGGWPVFCIFNFGETSKTVEYRGYKLMSCADFLFAVANVEPDIYYSHNVVTIVKPADFACEPYIITLAPHSSIVFTPVQYFGIPTGDNFENEPLCGCF